MQIRSVYVSKLAQEALAERRRVKRQFALGALGMIVGILGLALGTHPVLIFGAVVLAGVGILMQLRSNRERKVLDKFRV